jgi:hypothetical protein
VDSFTGNLTSSSVKESQPCWHSELKSQ